MSDALTLPAKESLSLFEFRYGPRAAPLYYRVTDDTRDVKLGSATYSSMPAIACKLPEQNGGITEDPAEVTMPLVLGEFPDLITKGTPFSETWLTVRAVRTVGMDGNTVTVPFVGRVGTRYRNPDGKAGIVKLLAQSPKTLLDVPLGVAANHTCWWALGQGGCKFDLAAAKLTPTVSAISGMQVTLDDGGGGGGALKGKATGYWKDGWIERDGIRIKIRDWAGTGSGTFWLTKRAPPTWVGLTVGIVPGCSQLWTICDTRHNQLENFFGIGAGMPSRNPLFEVT